MTTFGNVLYEYGTEVDGYVLDRHSFQEACLEAVRQGLVKIPTRFTGFVIDTKGAIYKDGVHVAWLNKACSVNELREFCEKLGANPPILDDISMVEEKGKYCYDLLKR